MDEMNDYLFTQLPVTHATTSYDKLEKPDDNGRYALHYACMKKESTFGQIERILSSNRRARRYRDINKKIPLHYAIELGPDANESIIELLLTHYMKGAEFMVYEYDRTLLHKAIMLGCKYEILEMLLHAYPDAITMKTLNTEHLPMHYGILYHSPYDIIRLLYHAYPKSLEMVDYLGRTPLHISIRNHCPINVVNYLIRRHPNGMKSVDKIGNTPFAVACEHGSFPPTIRLLYDSWPFCIHTSDFEGRTPLHKACRKGQYITVKFLLHVGAYTDVLTHQGETPFKRYVNFIYIYIYSDG